MENEEWVVVRGELPKRGRREGLGVMRLSFPNGHKETEAKVLVVIIVWYCRCFLALTSA